LRPLPCVLENDLDRILFIKKIRELINIGFNNIEIPWNESSNWLDLMSSLRSEFPYINLGSASNVNQRSINASINLNLNFSMMRFWDKNLFSYSKSNKHLLIPGINTFKDFEEAKTLDCNIIKIYPINKKENSLKIDCFNKEITFIAAGGLSISDIQKYKLFGYKAIVIGEKGFNGKLFDKRIYSWAEDNLT
tara:strand:- start:56 stop:631 length:576 start_codon:yes stop_codon:yes gene_type:complete